MVTRQEFSFSGGIFFEGIFYQVNIPDFCGLPRPPHSALPTKNECFLCGLHYTILRNSFRHFLMFLEGPKKNKSDILISTCINKSILEENAKLRNPPLKATFSLTTMKYRTQSAEQRVSKTNVILPSSEPMAPVIDVGGLFENLKLQYL